MATITVRLSDQDAELVRRYAEIDGRTVSDFVREAVFERIEDIHDLELLRQAIAEDDGTRYTLEDIKRELLL